MARKREYSFEYINTWLLLNQITASETKYEEKEFSEVGLTIPQFFIIAAIKYLQPPVTPTDLAQHLDRNLNTITLTLDRMEKAGLVKKKRDLPDRRTLRVFLTSKSKRLFSKAAACYADMPGDIMSCLSDDELKNLAELINKLRERLFNRLGVTEISSHRADAMNYVLQEAKASISPIHIEAIQPKDIS